MIYDRGEPAVSYKWTGWVWDITGWSSRLHENYQSFRGICRIHPNLIEGYCRMWTCNRLGLQTLGSQPVIFKNLPDHWFWLENSLKVKQKGIGLYCVNGHLETLWGHEFLFLFYFIWGNGDPQWKGAFVGLQKCLPPPPMELNPCSLEFFRKPGLMTPWW